MMHHSFVCMSVHACCLEQRIVYCKGVCTVHTVQIASVQTCACVPLIVGLTQLLVQTLTHVALTRKMPSCLAQPEQKQLSMSAGAQQSCHNVCHKAVAKQLLYDAVAGTTSQMATWVYR